MTTSKEVKNKEVLHTQGTLFADYGDYDRLKDADEIFLRIESEGETYDLARFGCNETENPKQWAELICKAVNERQRLIDSNRELSNALTVLMNMCGIIPREVFTQVGQNDFQALLDNGNTAINNAKNILP